MNNKLNEKDLKLFPDYEKFVSDLDKIDKINFNYTAEQIYNRFYDYAKIVPTNYGSFNPEKFNDFRFYRVRLNINREFEDISLIQTYSYPPPSVCNENGRANLKGKSVFYCSDNPHCSILESKPKIGDEGYLSFWKPESKRKIKFGICLPENLTNYNDWSLIANDIYDYQRKELKGEAKEKFEHLLILYKYIADKFVNEKKPYPITSMISNEYLYSDLWHDFIVYPSVVSKADYSNMAFHPNSVNDNLRFEKVLKFKVVDIINGQIKFNLGKVGFKENTKIVWRDITENESKIFRKE
jgi:hypothetical protein